MMPLWTRAKDCVIIKMRMGIDFSWFAMRRPTGLSNRRHQDLDFSDQSLFPEQAILPTSLQ